MPGEVSKPSTFAQQQQIVLRQPMEAAADTL
jgi:hypothetical protein